MEEDPYFPITPSLFHLIPFNDGSTEPSEIDEYEEEQFKESEPSEDDKEPMEELEPMKPLIHAPLIP